ncbi:hypothetical protein MAR_003388, partial [Mya arenaria]
MHVVEKSKTSFQQKPTEHLKQGPAARSFCSRNVPIISIEEICLIPKDVDMAKLHSCLDLSYKGKTYTNSIGCFTILGMLVQDRIAGEDGIPINDSRTYGFDDSPEVVDDDIDGSAICHKGICKISCVIAKAVNNAMEVKQSIINESFGCFKIPNKADAIQPLVSLDSEDIDVVADYPDSEDIDVVADSFGPDGDDAESDTLELDVFSPFGVEDIYPSTRPQKAMLTLLKSLQEKTAINDPIYLGGIRWCSGIIRHLENRPDSRQGMVYTSYSLGRIP